ncbi:MAG: hypothetical protein V7K89_31180 [Nostoc sp.]|uniref:hypothetical protein n=1 Tax=Nostoc sp. TaxID=1180 RepID=UPI002FFCEFE0
MLELYQQILDQGQVRAVDNQDERELILSGLLVKEQNYLKIHNRIYELIFNICIGKGICSSLMPIFNQSTNCNGSNIPHINKTCSTITSPKKQFTTNFDVFCVCGINPSYGLLSSDTSQ